MDAGALRENAVDDFLLAGGLLDAAAVVVTTVLPRLMDAELVSCFEAADFDGIAIGHLPT